MASYIRQAWQLLLAAMLEKKRESDLARSRYFLTEPDVGYPLSSEQRK
jgi:hypothetical protein